MGRRGVMGASHWPCNPGGGELSRGRRGVIGVSYWPCNMAIQVVEFSNRVYKIRKFLPKNQPTQRKLLNFDFWINGELSKSVKT